MSIDPNVAKKMAEAYTVAWNSGSPQAVAQFYAEDGQIMINRGDPWIGRARLAEMAAGFFADAPDLELRCDGVRCAGDDVVYLWTLVGHPAQTRNPLEISGWEEWELDVDRKVRSSGGWYDADDYRRQVDGA